MYKSQGRGAGRGYKTISFAIYVEVSYHLGIFVVSSFKFGWIAAYMLDSSFYMRIDIFFAH